MEWKHYTYWAVAAGSLYVFWPSIQDWFFELTPFGYLRRQPMPSKRTTVGLINRANDCFANSNLQALAGCPSLFCYLTQVQFMCPESNKDMILLTRTLYSLMEQLNERVTSPKSISPQPLITAIERIYQSYLSRSQHDAHEMLHLILETLENEAAALRKLVPATPEFIFQGKTADTLKCLLCGVERDSAQTSFLVLTLAVPQQRSTDLQTLLDEFFGIDTIHDYRCEECGRTSSVQKRTRILEPPETLAIHLNRSIYAGGAQRNSCKVAVPEYFELGASTTRKYKLSSIVRHSGTHLSGHYECVRRRHGEFWRKHSNQFDDETNSAASSLYSPSLNSIRSVRSVSSTESELPFPPPASAVSSVSTISGHASRDMVEAPRDIKPRRRVEKLWSISDTVVKETNMEKALGAESANYLLFYEKVADKRI